ncbi:MAG TPA: carbohydrate-binding protein [Bacteroidales bacterium]
MKRAMLFYVVCAFSLSVSAQTLIPAQIEAENFTGKSSGITTESCSDSTGGLSIKKTSDGSYLYYAITVPKAGLYRVSYRVSSAATTAGAIALTSDSGSTVYGVLEVPSTGGLQNWKTLSHQVFLPASTFNISVDIPKGGFGINWLKFEKVNDSANQASGTATIYTSTKTTQLIQSTQPFASSSGTPVYVDASTTFQTMQGFGAAVTGSSALLINALSETNKAKFLNDVFSESGLGLNYIRTTIGASDFSSSVWTHDDGNRTFEFKDPEGVMTVLKAVRTLNPDLKIIASAWSPPSYMKTYSNTTGWSYNTAYGDSLSNYYIHYLQAMKDNGIPVDAMTVQNEPLWGWASYPCMYMPANAQGFLVGNYLGPKLRSNNLSTKLYIYDHNWDNALEYATTVKKTLKAWQFVDGTTFHSYSSPDGATGVASQSYVKYLDMSKDILFTEGTGWGSVKGDFGATQWEVLHIMIESVRNWASGVILWNLALNENYGPVIPGGPTNCRGVFEIKSDGSSYSENAEYYTLAHLSKFVKPGAKRINSICFNSTIKNVAFVNPDGSRVALLYNTSDLTIQISIKEGNISIPKKMTGGSIATFVWSPDSNSSANLMQVSVIKAYYENGLLTVFPASDVKYLDIYSVDGAKIRTIAVDGQEQIILSTAYFAPGIYLLKDSLGGILKFVK